MTYSDTDAKSRFFQRTRPPRLWAGAGLALVILAVSIVWLGVYPAHLSSLIQACVPG